MGNCSGKSIFYDAIFPNNLRTYFPLIILTLGLLWSLPAGAQMAMGLRKVVIDAGHGGHDPGAVGKITYEKHITLAIALKLGQYIEEQLPGVEVVYTRKTDVFVALDERSNIANTAKADVFISVHVNSLEQASAQGTSSWVMGLHVSEENLAIAQRENSVIKLEKNHQAKYEGYDPTSVESYIIFSLMQNQHLAQSLDLAARIQKEFRLRVGRKDRGVNQAGFVVLWKTSMPAVLVETGFISNPAEERFLASAQGQDYLASAIFRAFRDYKQQLEKNLPPTTRPNGTTAKEPTANKSKPDVQAAHGTASHRYFAVQLASSATKLSSTDTRFAGIEQLNEQAEAGVYRYYAGRCPSYQQAKALRDKLAGRFPGLFVVAFDGGKKVPVQQALGVVQP